MKKFELTPDQRRVVAAIKKDTLTALQEIRAEFVEEIRTSNKEEDVLDAIVKLCNTYFAIFTTVFEEYYYEGIFVTDILNGVSHRRSSPTGFEEKTFVTLEMTDEFADLQSSVVKTFSDFIWICINAARKENLSPGIATVLAAFQTTAPIEHIFKGKYLDLCTGLILAHKMTNTLKDIQQKVESSSSKIDEQKSSLPTTTDDETDFN